MNSPCRLLIIFAISICGVACDSLPRDPENTLKRVQGGSLRVGLVEHPPWVVRTSGEPAGAEVELVRQLASELGATPEWHWGGEQQHMEALEYFELDMVIGGVTGETPWSKYVGLTSPYFEERILVGVPNSTTPPRNIEGMQVAVKKGEATAAYLKKKGAAPVPVDELSEWSGPTAAPEWQLEAMGFALNGVELVTERHVMAIPPGENGWLKRLDEFLYQRRSEVKNLLQQEIQR